MDLLHLSVFRRGPLRCDDAALRMSLFAAVPSKRVRAREIIPTVRVKWPYVLSFWSILLVAAVSAAPHCRY